MLCVPKLGLADDAAQIQQINQAYLQAWLRDDAAAVLALFEPEARISPNRLFPIEGLEGMRAFWFPDGGSVTTIHRSKAEDLGVSVLGELGVTTQKTVLEWSYEKGDTRMARLQEGINTTVFRRQPDGGWKIWREMWTDVAVRDR